MKLNELLYDDLSDDEKLDNIKTEIADLGHKIETTSDRADCQATKHPEYYDHREHIIFYATDVDIQNVIDEIPSDLPKDRWYKFINEHDMEDFAYIYKIADEYNMTVEGFWCDGDGIDTSKIDIGFLWKDNHQNTKK